MSGASYPQVPNSNYEEDLIEVINHLTIRIEKLEATEKHRENAARKLSDNLNKLKDKNESKSN